VFQTRPSWNYTTFLDFAALAVAAVLGWRFLRTGGPAMLRAMGASPDEKAKLALDPVCGMSVDPATATARSDYDGKSYVFCSAGCKSAFDKDPDQFVGRAAQHRHPH
jgi:Cu+-exporting ATPase